MIESPQLPGPFIFQFPAHPDFIAMAKRLASGLGSYLGFTLDAVDDLNIAVAQACDSAIEQALEVWGSGQLKLTFSSTEKGIAVDVEALPPKARPLPARRTISQRDAEVRRLTHEMIRCFVDDFRANVEPSRVRIRMVKYLIG